MEFPEEEIAVRRAEIVSELQSRIMDEYNEARMDTVMEVLCEGYDPEEDRYYGRTYADSPDIDGRVLFESESTVKVGTFVMVRITDVCDGDLCGYVEEA